jgi:DNA polymerase I-like protein with 3'-5' exonuclease and polymerase domains
MKKTRLVFVDTREKLSSLIKYCKQTKYCSLDFETTGTEFYDPDHYPTILGISFQPGSAWIIPLGHFDSVFKNSYINILREFSREVLENPDIVKYAFNMKFEHKWLLQYGGNLRGRIIDVMLAKYLLDEERPNDLKSLVKRLLPDYSNYEDEVDTLKKKHGGWDKIPLLPLSEYCGLDCDLTLRLGIYLEKICMNKGFYPLLRNLLMMGHRVLTESEFDGTLIDKSYVKGLVKLYAKKLKDEEKKLRSNKKLRKFERKREKAHKLNLIEETKREIDKLIYQGKSPSDRVIKNRQEKISRYIAGQFTTKKEILEPFNFSSPKQLIEFLFENKFGFKFTPSIYTESGAPSTSEEVLVELKERDKSGFIQSLLNHRELSKLYSTYIKGMYEQIGPDSRIHGSFLLHGTVTGRLSSREPNLQNIPRDTTSSDIKRMFIPPPGYLLLEVDYSQAELRVVAEIAKEETLIDIFQRDYNVHVATACKANGVLDRYDEIRKILKDPNHKDWLFWEKQKKRAKLINFGILYGQTEKKLSIELECSEEEAKQFIDDWYKMFPKVARWIKKQHKFVKEHGYVQSIWGRKRRLPDIYSDQFGKFLKAQRDAVNAPIQGAASDYTLFSSVIIREEKRKLTLPYDMPQLYTVHDSLGYAIRPELIHSIVPKIIEICNNPQTKKWFGFEMKKVRMKVSPEIGVNWGALQDYNPNEDYTKLINTKGLIL